MINDSNKIVFGKLSVQNFLSIGDKIEFDFEKHRGTNYIFGYNADSTQSDVKNGVGKSTLICDAILFALFGQTGKQLSKTSVVNRTRGKNCEVSLCFTIGSDKYRIISGISPTYTYLYKNDIDITKSSMKETHSFICAEVLRTNFDIFKNSIILSVNDTTTIFQMSKAQKREFIETIFDLSVYGRMFKQVREDLNVLEKHLQAETAACSKSIGTLSKLRDSDAKFVETTEQQLRDIQAQIDTIKSKDRTTYDIASMQTSLEDIRLGSEKHNGSISKLTDAIGKLNSKLSVLNNTKSSLEANIKKHTAVYECLCDTCKTNVEPIVNIQLYTTQLAETESQIVDITGKINTYKPSLTKLNDAKRDSDSAYRVLSSDISRSIAHNELVSKIDNSISILESKKETISASVNPYSDMIVDLDADIKKVSGTIEGLTVKKLHLKQLEKFVSEDGVKKWVITGLINVLNDRIKQYLVEMGADYIVIFDPNFDYKFFTPTGESEYHGFSAGERMRINHSTLFALKDMLDSQGTLSSSILVCDEILDTSICTKGTECIMNIIRKCSVDQTVYVISHKEQIANSNQFDNIIEMVRRNGFTSIVSDPQGEGLGS